MLLSVFASFSSRIVATSPYSPGPTPPLDMFENIFDADDEASFALVDSDHSEPEEETPGDTTSAEETSSGDSPTNQYPDYSRSNWEAAIQPTSTHFYWSVSIEEFRAMSDGQWSLFGTAYYIPPEGFNTREKHIADGC